MNIGDVVRGNDKHMNPERMQHMGVIIGYTDRGYWVTWVCDLPETHFAPFNEVELVYDTWLNAADYVERNAA